MWSDVVGFLYLFNNQLSVFDLHDVCLTTSEEYISSVLWILEVNFDEYRSIFGNDIETSADKYIISRLISFCRSLFW